MCVHARQRLVTRMSERVMVWGREIEGWGSCRGVSSLQAGWRTLSPLIARNIRLRGKKDKSVDRLPAHSKT